MAEEATFPGSTSLQSATYDAGVLTVTFQSGDRYIYTAVPESVWKGLQSAGSAGSYFYANIRNRFPYEQA